MSTWNATLVVAVLGVGVASGAVTLGAGCTAKDTTYCDGQTPCSDPQDVCNLGRSVCERAPQTDAGADRALDAATDGGRDASRPDRGDDAGDDASGPPDDACAAPLRACMGECYALDDPAHCGAGCTLCPTPTNGQATCDGVACDFTCSAGYWHNTTTCDTCNVGPHCGPSCIQCPTTTPECQGGTCVCNATSCAGTTPVCNQTTGVCRPCSTHDECQTGICDDDGSCVAEADTIYVGITNCSDSGQGTKSVPFCSLGVALTTAKAGPRHAIRAASGLYHVNGSQDIDYRLIIVGAGSGSTTFTQDASDTAVLHVWHRGYLTLLDVGVVGASAFHAVTCDTPSSGNPALAIDRCALVNGGAMGMYVNMCNLTLTRSNVDSNATYGLWANNSTVVLEQTKFTRNKYGGLLFAGGTFEVGNCLIAQNGADSGTSVYGGVVMSGVGSDLSKYRFMNNTVAGNKAPSSLSDHGGIYADATVWLWNSIVYGNTPSEVSSTLFPLYCDINGWSLPDPNGNLSGVPLFVSPATLNYHLQGGSPCTNAGHATGYPESVVDLDGNPRSGNPDMGCYEAQ